MGLLYYGETNSPLEFDDRLLAHLKIAITQKLRRAEAFTLSWVHPHAGRTTIWLSQASTLRFEFDSPDVPEIDLQWLDRLARQAGTTNGMVVVDEDVDASPDIPITPPAA